MRLMTTTVILALTMALSACSDDGPTTPSAPPIPSYAGIWTGSYTITGCSQNGGVAIANICGSIGATPQYRFDFNQSGSSVTGAFALGSITFPSTGGTVQSDGSLALQATTIQNGVTVIVNWALRNAGGANPAITGTVTQNWTSTVLSGSANVAGTISNSIRQQSVGGTRATTALRGPVTLEQLIAAVAEQ